jgi:2-polyprenyl-3-methyl-5-hydroxy-6-metoxy-1,4-benzoquinol methylase
VVLDHVPILRHNLKQNAMITEHRHYGWTNARANESHDILVPALRKVMNERLGSKRGRVLDIGCGNGYVTAQLAKQGHEVVGIDASEDGIILARQAHPEIRFLVGSAYDEEVASVVGDGFDMIISLEVVEHLFYPRRLLNQAHRLLGDGAFLILSTPYHGYWKNLAISLLSGWDRHFGVGLDGGHIKFFSQHTLQGMLLEAGFEDIRFAGAGRVPYLWKSMLLSAAKGR